MYRVSTKDKSDNGNGTGLYVRYQVSSVLYGYVPYP